MKGIINGKIITDKVVLEDKVLVYDKKIAAMIDKNQVDLDKDIEIIDAKGHYISPGLIDIHIHGIEGYDVMDGTIESLQNISQSLLKNGVTSFLPTTMTMDKQYIYRALDVIKKLKSVPQLGAKILGAHLEGPFINRKYKGAQNEEFIVTPSYEFIEKYIDIIKILTLAPEMDQNNEFIDKMKQHQDVVLSIGHSNANYEQAMTAIENGFRHAAHTFNAMRPFHHREPGVVGAIFNSDVSCELIADKIHVHPAHYQLLTNIKGLSKVVLITDSIRAACMKEGQYDLGGQMINVCNGSARLQDGTLAGSVLTLNKALKNVLENTNLSICEVVQLASLNPAKVIGVSNHKGSIKIGKDADIIIFDEYFNIYNTIVQGKTVYHAEGIV